MAIAKCVTGIWLTVLPASPGFLRKIKEVVGRRSKNRNKETTIRQRGGRNLEASSGDPSTACLSLKEIGNGKNILDHASAELTFGRNIPAMEPVHSSSHHPLPQTTSSSTNKSHKNFYPALLLGLAMTTRGEIGFLIAAVGQTAGLLVPQEVYLVVVWGILLCTIIGPICVRIILGRIEKAAIVGGGRKEVLGGWGEADVPQATDDTHR